MSDLHCPARIIVARHGDTEYERPEMGVSGGSLSPLGRRQARELGERLRAEKVAGVICSELSRAAQRPLRSAWSIPSCMPTEIPRSV